MSLLPVTLEGSPDPRNVSLLRSQRIVTVLGLGFQGRAEVVPVVIANGEFPDLGNSETVRRIFNLPENKPPHFLLLSRRNASAGLERSLERLGHLLPSGTR